MYDIKTHGDFRKLYDTTQERAYWVLGYFGGGSVNIAEAYELAKQYAESTKSPLSDVQIDEVLHSRRYKGFKVLFSSGKTKKEKDSEEHENVWNMLTQ
jgi:hypothetical protein